MEKMFCMGLAIGFLGGALIAANSCKARNIVRKSQDEVIKRTEQFIDEKTSQKEECKGGECAKESGL